MRIPVFVSCPTGLAPTQEASRTLIIDYLTDLEFEARALGRSDYPTELPLREVLVIAKHCAGGIILGFEQIWCERGERKRGTPVSARLKKPISLPTPWNNLEAGILFGLGLPLLIFEKKEFMEASSTTESRMYLSMTCQTPRHLVISCGQSS